MADELKRVGFIFKEDGATDFVKSLQNVNAEISKNYSAFKKTQAQWDESTKKTEKLKYQIENLSNAYDLQKDKVTILKAQLNELENAEKQNVTAINKKRAELEKAELKVISYEKKIKELSNQLKLHGKDITEVGEKISKFGKGIENVGKKVSAFSGATVAALGLSAKAGIDFEDDFAGVEKTVDGTAEEMAILKQGIRDMAKEIPSTTTEISAVAEAAGQLGIKKESILDFTKTMIDMGNATNLSSEEAATTLARFANVTKMSQSDFSKLGSTIVALGNNFATTESEITQMGMNLASAGTQVGMTQPQIMALATALSSVGLEAQAGGTAFSRVMVNMQLAVEKGGDSLKDFADVAGMSSKDFQKAFKEDATGAIMKFVEGLSKSDQRGKSAIKILDDMEIKETRLRDALLRSANASEIFSDAIQTGTKAWEDNTALTNEANKRYGTLKSQITITLNKIKDMAITLGNKLMPHIQKIIKSIGEWIQKFDNLNDEQVDLILKIGMFIAAMGPAISIIGKLTSVTGGVIKTIGTFKTALEVTKGLTTSTSSAVNGLASIFSALKTPAGIAALAIGALVTACVTYAAITSKNTSKLKELREEVENQKKTWSELGEKRQEALSADMTQIDYCETLYDELKQITDENGKVKAGYEARAQIILTSLNKALGTEYKLNKDIISQYGELKNKINEIIVAKKGESTLNAYQAEYETAIKDQAKATETLVGLKKELIEANKKVEESEGEAQIRADFKRQEIVRKIKEETDLIGSYGKTIQNYENLQKATIEGSTEAISKAVEEMGISYEKFKDKSGETLEQQIINQGTYVKSLKGSLKEAINDNDEYQSKILENQIKLGEKQLENLTNSLLEQTSTIKSLTPSQILAWETIGNSSIETYNKAISQLPPETREQIGKVSKIVSENVELPNNFGTIGGLATISYRNNLNIKGETSKEISSASNELKTDTSVQKEAGNLTARAHAAIKSNNSEVWGMDMVRGLGTGIKKEKEGSWFRGILSGLASTVAGYIHFSRPDKGPLREYEEWMPDMVEGLGKSLTKSSPKLIKSIKEMSNKMSEELKNTDSNLEIKTMTNNNENTTRLEIDYNRMSKAITESLTNCKFTLDEDGFARIVKDELYKVV